MWPPATTQTTKNHHRFQTQADKGSRWGEEDAQGSPLKRLGRRRRLQLDVDLDRGRKWPSARCPENSLLGRCTPLVPLRKGGQGGPDGFLADFHTACRCHPRAAEPRGAKSLGGDPGRSYLGAAPLRARARSRMSEWAGARQRAGRAGRRAWAQSGLPRRAEKKAAGEGSLRPHPPRAPPLRRAPRAHSLARLSRGAGRRGGAGGAATRLPRTPG